MRFSDLCCDREQDGRIKVADFQQFLQEQVFILNTHLESQGEQPVFAVENLLEQGECQPTEQETVNLQLKTLLYASQC